MSTGTRLSLKAVVIKQPNVSAAITLKEKANKEFALDRTVFIFSSYTTLESEQFSQPWSQSGSVNFLETGDACTSSCCSFQNKTKLYSAGVVLRWATILNSYGLGFIQTCILMYYFMQYILRNNLAIKKSTSVQHCIRQCDDFLFVCISVSLTQSKKGSSLKRER